MNGMKAMGTGAKVLIALAVVAVILVVVCVGIYNGLVSSETTVDNAFANIDVQLQRRNDLIPNLVNTVQGYAAHEQEVIGQVTEARARMMSAGTVDEKIAADGELSSALSRLLAISEAYPDLKANENFLSLQDELAGTENRIAVSRKDYNDAVMVYNKKLRTFPNNLLAGMFGFEKRNAFTASPGASQVPQVSFNG